MKSTTKSLFHPSASQAFEYFGIQPASQEELQQKLTEKHRFYHNYEHINDIIGMIESYDASKYNYNLTSIERRVLLAAALYHDAIYNPLLKNNEEKSAEYFISHCTKGSTRTSEMQLVSSIIKDTFNHVPSTKISQIFCDFDLRGLKEGDFLSMLVGEKKVFLEFQKYDYSQYKQGRIDFLKNFLENHKGHNDANIQALINYVQFRVPNIAVYAGSFNPFHKGHLNIVEKAEQIFDKVIIAKGINPEKQQKSNIEELSNKLYYRQVEEFDTLLSDYVVEKSKDANITVIRGLRNGNDLSYEINQGRFIDELDETNSIKSIFIHCDQQYEHISSSAIRNMLASGNQKMIDKAKNYTEV